MKNGYYKDEDGHQEWWVNDKLHREDGPAVINASGTQIWYLNDELHREDGPARIWSNGTQDWYLNGKLHRENGPAIIWADGSQVWFINGKNITDEVNKWFDDYNLIYETMDEEEKWYLIFYIRSLL
jgi:hypothetical protein